MQLDGERLPTGILQNAASGDPDDLEDTTGEFGNDGGSMTPQ